MANGMTISEAEELLGISVDRSRDDISAAYRAMAKKYHPDAWLNKSPEEQKRASQIYMKLSQAKSVLMNPSTAAPEPDAHSGGVDIPDAPFGDGYDQQYEQSYTYTPGHSEYQNARQGYAADNDAWADGGVPAGRSSTYVSPRQRHQSQRSTTVTSQAQTYTYTPPNRRNAPDFNPHMRTADSDNTPPAANSDSWVAPGSSQGEREKYNAAKSFADRFGMVKDPQEDKYAHDYGRYAIRRFRRSSDVLRWSSSAIVTVAAFLMTMFLLMSSGALQLMLLGRANTTGNVTLADGTAVSVSNSLLMLILCVAKFFIYDLITCHYVTKSIRSSNRFMMGMPLTIGGIAIFVAGYLLVMPWVGFVYAAIACAVIGVVIGVVSGVSARDEQQQATQ